MSLQENTLDAINFECSNFFFLALATAHCHTSVVSTKPEPHLPQKVHKHIVEQLSFADKVCPHLTPQTAETEINDNAIRVKHICCNKIDSYTGNYYAQKIAGTGGSIACENGL